MRSGQTLRVQRRTEGSYETSTKSRLFQVGCLALIRCCLHDCVSRLSYGAAGSLGFTAFSSMLQHVSAECAVGLRAAHAVRRQSSLPAHLNNVSDLRDAISS